MDKNFDPLADLMKPREVYEADVVISAAKPAPLEVTIENIVRNLFEVTDFNRFNLKYSVGHFRKVPNPFHDTKFVFARKMKGEPVKLFGGPVNPETGKQELSATVEPLARGGFVEVSVSVEGKTLVSKVNAPKDAPYNRRVLRQEAVKQIKKQLILFLVEKQRAAK